jgi:hypothetical protein
MSGKHTLVRVSVVLLSITLAGCSQPVDHARDTSAGVLEVHIIPPEQAEVSQEVAAEIMPILEAFFWGAVEDRRSLIQYITVGCTTADGLGGPPKCAPGEAEGTLVEVFPIGEAEGHFVRPEEIDRTLEFTVDGLYAVYRQEPGVDPVEYWPVGEYALLFERQMYNTSQPVTAFVQDGRLVRLDFLPYPVDPAQLLGAIPLDRILIPPEEARALTEQVMRPR